MKPIWVYSLLVCLTACGGTDLGGSSSGSSSSSSSAASSSTSSSSSSSSSGDPIEPATLKSVLWELRYLEDPMGVRTASNVPFTLFFGEDHVLKGSTSCETFETDYWVRGTHLGLNNIPEIPAGCPEYPWSKIERAYYQALKQLPARYEVTASSLRIFPSGAQHQLVFEALGPKCANPLRLTGPLAPTRAIDASISVNITSNLDLETLIQRLESTYPDMVLRKGSECSSSIPATAPLAISVNQVTLEYLRCRDDILTISLP